MMDSRRTMIHQRRAAVAVALFAIVTAAAMGMMISCGGNPSSSGSGMGSATVSISDPPSCGAPAGNFKSVFVTIRSVQAHISATADPGAAGWQELAPQLVTQPKQVDLLNLPQDGQCLLAQLGSTSSLPVGDYQQIRLILLANNPSGGPLPTSNACASLGQVFNCVKDKNNNFAILNLSSEANTGLKVPPGQILGGPIHVTAGQNVDINVDFDACNSLVQEGNGSFRLKPTLTAGVVSPNTTGISGQVVDSATKLPVAGATVALEQADSGSVDRIMFVATADSSGRFNFCPLPQGATFDVVIDAVTGAGLAYNATVVPGIPGGTNLGAVQIVAETGTATGPGVLQGFVTSANGTTGVKITAALSAFQAVTISGATRQITIPLEKTGSQNSTPNVSVESIATCPGGSPTGAFCAQYTLVVPASNPNVGKLSGGTITYTAPAAGDVLYSVEAKATSATSPGTPTCSPSTQTVNQDTGAMPLKVTAGATTTPKRIDFTGCS